MPTSVKFTSSRARIRILIFVNASKTSTSFSCAGALGRNLRHNFSRIALYNRDSSGMPGHCKKNTGAAIFPSLASLAGCSDKKCFISRVLPLLVCAEIARFGMRSHLG